MWKFYTSAGALKVGPRYTIGSSPPSSPIDGDRWVYTGVSGLYLEFIYDSSETTYKWKFVGGPPLSAFTTTFDTTTSTTYTTSLASTSGPSITAPRNGDYDIAFGAGYMRNSASGPSSLISVDDGTTAAADADSCQFDTTVADNGGPGMVTLRRTAIVAGNSIAMKYRASANTAKFGKRWMRVTPVRII